MAIEIWPSSAAELFSCKKDHGRAEACLIALWGAASGGRRGWWRMNGENVSAGLGEREAVSAAIDVLVERHHCRPVHAETGPTGGRPSLEFLWNPCLQAQGKPHG